jgi:hypothetical protein
MNDKNYLRLAALVVASWLVIALALSAKHAFHTRSDAPPVGIALAVLIPVALFFVAYRASEGFRSFALSLSPQALTIVQSWRAAGLIFVTLYAYRILPGLFALPAGWGDMFIGFTAPFVALRLTRPEHRSWFLAWQILGILDLVDAVALGGAARFVEPHGLPTDAMALLPLSVIPTFLVPLLLILHIISIAQARRWHAPQPLRVAGHAPASAA